MDILAALEKPAEDTYLNCIRCGLCLSVCPTYREYLTETASPRGRVALASKAPNKLGEDITVPRSTIPEVVRRLKEISENHGLPIVIFGHAGDGNLHPNILFHKRDPEHWAKVEKMVAEIFAASLAVGDTLSGEHGVGLLKRPYLEQALGPVSLSIQKQLKQALDPLDILNPGKMFPIIDLT